MVVALLMVAEQTYHDFVLTGGTEDHPKRLPNSLHKVGMAIDVRYPEYNDELYADPIVENNAWKTRIESVFKDTEYDLVWYDTHVHIEFDPK